MMRINKKSFFELLIACMFFFLSYSLQAMDLNSSYNLINKTGFAPNYNEIKKFHTLNKNQAVNYLLQNVVQSTQTQPPTWLLDTSKHSKMIKVRTTSPKVYKAMFQASRESLANWWFDEIILTKSPITEKMTLFWHNYFKSSFTKTGDPFLFFEQNKTLRENAFGYFPVLLEAIAKDPGYIQQTTLKGKIQPIKWTNKILSVLESNHNKYSTKETYFISNSFNSWGYILKNDKFIFQKQKSTPELKMLFGQNKNWQGEQVLKEIASKNSVHKKIVQQLCIEFIGRKVSPEMENKLIISFQQSGLHIKTLLKEILLSPDFWQTDLRKAKSPLEYFAGLFRQINKSTTYLPSIDKKLKKMGYDIFNHSKKTYWNKPLHLKVRRNFTRLVVSDQLNIKNKSVTAQGIDNFLKQFSIDEDPKHTKKIASTILLGTTRFDPKLLETKNNKQFLLQLFSQNLYLTK